MLEGPSADSEEKHEPVSDIDTAPMEGLKALDPKRPIREADMCGATRDVRFGPIADIVIRSPRRRGKEVTAEPQDRVREQPSN